MDLATGVVNLGFPAERCGSGTFLSSLLSFAAAGANLNFSFDVRDTGLTCTHGPANWKVPTVVKTTFEVESVAGAKDVDCFYNRSADNHHLESGLKTVGVGSGCQFQISWMLCKIRKDRVGNYS
jgi:hypothetical protein